MYRHTSWSMWEPSLHFFDQWSAHGQFILISGFTFATFPMESQREIINHLFAEKCITPCNFIWPNVAPSESGYDRCLLLFAGAVDAEVALEVLDQVTFLWGTLSTARSSFGPTPWSNASSGADAFQQGAIPDEIADMDMNWFRENWVQVFEKDIAARESQDSRVEWLENKVGRLRALLGQESEASVVTDIPGKMNNHNTYWAGAAAQAPVHHTSTKVLDTSFRHPQMKTGPRKHTIHHPFANQPHVELRASQALETITEAERKAERKRPLEDDSDDQWQTPEKRPRYTELGR